MSERADPMTPQPTADDLALAREIEEATRLMHPPSDVIETIASLIANHRHPPPPAMPAPTVAGWYECRHKITDDYRQVRWWDGKKLWLMAPHSLVECVVLEYADFRLLTYTTPPAPQLTIEEQMAEIDRKLASTPGIKFGPLEKLFTAKATPSIDELRAENERLRQAAEAYRTLATCYRLGQSPSGELLEETEKARTALNPKVPTP